MVCVACGISIRHSMLPWVLGTLCCFHSDHPDTYKIPMLLLPQLTSSSSRAIRHSQFAQHNVCCVLRIFYYIIQFASKMLRGTMYTACNTYGNVRKRIYTTHQSVTGVHRQSIWCHLSRRAAVCIVGCWYYCSKTTVLVY